MPSRDGALMPAPDRPPPVPAAVASILAETLARLRFGEIRLTIHNGRVLQVEVTEKTRLAEG